MNQKTNARVHPADEGGNRSRQSLRHLVRNNMIQDYGEAEGYICVGWIWERSPQPPHRGKYAQAFYKYPDQLSAAVDKVMWHYDAGHCLYRPTSLCINGTSRTLTVPSAVVSFEIDEMRDKAHTQTVLKSVGASIISSGTPGHFHVSVRIRDRELTHEQLSEVGRRLYAACDISDGGKYLPNDNLRIIGTRNRKPHRNDAEVRLRHEGKGTSWENLKAVLHEHHSLIQRNYPKGREVGGKTTGTRLQVADIEPQPISWSEVHPSVRSAYKNIPRYGDDSRGCWAFFRQCVKAGLTDSQILYLTTELNTENYIPKRYTTESIIQQVNKARARNHVAARRGR